MMKSIKSHSLATTESLTNPRVAPQTSAHQGPDEQTPKTKFLSSLNCISFQNGSTSNTTNPWRTRSLITLRTAQTHHTPHSHRRPRLSCCAHPRDIRPAVPLQRPRRDPPLHTLTPHDTGREQHRPHPFRWSRRCHLENGTISLVRSDSSCSRCA